VQPAVDDVPGERVAAVVDVRAQRIEVAVQRLRLARLAAVERAVGALEALGLAAMDLAAITPPFVDDDGSHAGFHQRLRTAHAGRPGADDDHSRGAHVVGHVGASVMMASPSSAK
jgi:hypothetical protein